jgi:hypothetical protein
MTGCVRLFHNDYTSSSISSIASPHSARPDYETWALNDGCVPHDCRPGDPVGLATGAVAVFRRLSAHHVAEARFRCERRPVVVDRLDLTVFQRPLVEQNLAGPREHPQRHSKRRLASHFPATVRIRMKSSAVPVHRIKRTVRISLVDFAAF